MFIRINKLFLSCVLVAGVLSAAAFAGTEPDPQELLAKSFQQANIWSQGPVKLVANMRRPAANGQELNRQLTVYWAGPEKWRAEWSDPHRDDNQIGGRTGTAEAVP